MISYATHQNQERLIEAQRMPHKMHHVYELKTPFVDEFIRKITLARNEIKKNSVIGIVGEPGSGKSYAALSFAEYIQPNFSANEQIIYHPVQLLKKIKEARENRYKVLILDEAHATINARTWHSFINLATNMVLNTFRQLCRLNLFIVSPTINEVDVSVRRLLNYYFVVERTTNKYSIVYPYEISFNYLNLQQQEPYLKSPYINVNGHILVVKQFYVLEPSERIINEYENTAIKFKQELLERKLKEIEESLKSDINQNTEEIITFLLNNHEILNKSFRITKSGTFKINKQMMKSLFKMSDTEIIKFETLLEQKLKELSML